MIIKIVLSSIIVIFGIIIWKLNRRNVLLSKKYNNIKEFFGDVDSVVNSVRYGNLSVRADSYSPKETVKLTKSINRMIETLNDREQMIREYQYELTKKNNFMAALLNTLSDGILVCDEDFVVIDANTNISKWVPNINLQNAKLEDFMTVAQDKTFDSLDNDEIFLKGTKDLFFKATTKVLDSKEHDGKYMIVISNYTTQKEIESLKEDFVATLTHDLKVPIIAASNMLDFFVNGKFGELTDVQVDALNNMKTSNKELLELVQIVLDTYKVKEGEIDLNIESVSVKNLLDDVAEEMKSIAMNNNNKLVISLKKDFKIKVDYLQIKRVIKNLVNNAILYGKPDTDIEITPKQDSENTYITIKDYGKGISKEDIDKIFNKYYSAHTKFRKIGTGLGLYLSKKLVQAHGGELSVKSKEGEWTEFCITIPL